MAKVYEHPKSLEKSTLHYCPGCSHGIVHRILAEVIDEMGLEGDTVIVAPVGCSYNCYEYFTFDGQQAAHGRAPAVATGVKRSLPDKVVLTYQGDGDLAAIGTAEIVHAAARGEKITTLFINNAIYGMTNGQMAPTTLLSQKTTTSPEGRDASLHGQPIRVSEMLATLDGAVYIERCAVNNPKNIMATKRAIKKAIKIQQQGLGFAMVEILSTCPTNWEISPVKALTWLEENMMPFYPMGVLKGQDLEVK